ncbi:MAG: ATP-binding cassette domain-containing protein [Patescibacteria group bacterium]|jgi:ATPase subunit of ABC transporter with duplicated ATPase domains
MIHVTLDKKETEISFDIDINFRTAILGENGIGKTSILESIASKSSKKDWLSVFVPENIGVRYLSQIELKTQAISGGEHMKQRLEALFSQIAEVYVLDEPTNNLDKNNIEWLKQYIINNKLPVVFTSHDIEFIDEIAEVIFYLDSKSVDKTKEKCSLYLVSRQKKIEHAFLMYEVALKKQRELLDSAQKAKQKSEAGSKWKGTDNDKFLRGFNRNAAGKGASTASRLKERAEEMEIERPKTDPLPNVVITPNIFRGNLFDITTTTLSQKRIDVSVKSGDKLFLVGANGIGKTTLIEYITKLLENAKPKVGDSFLRRNKFSYLYIKQDWYEHLDNQKIEEYLETFGLNREEKYKSLSFNRIDRNVLNKQFKDISPGIRIKVLLGVLSCKKYDLIIWDEPTNHLDVMTQFVLRDAFLKYDGGLLVVSHDKIFTDNPAFSIILL